jgi:hypothetical protein
MIDKKDSLDEKLYECNMHKKRLQSARTKLKPLMPLTLEVYEDMDDIFSMVIDQMIFRFSKLQDTLGDKVFSKLLELSGEDVKKMTFLDKLNRLEELEILTKESWMHLREYRNEIAHEYSFNQDEVVDSINLIYEKSDVLIAILDTLQRFAEEKLK